MSDFFSLLFVVKVNNYTDCGSGYAMKDRHFGSVG